MSTLMLRGLPTDLVARVRSYARSTERSLPDAAAHLLDVALDALAHAEARGRARAENLSPEDRSRIAREAAQTRWQRR